jgi:hypothetical protein
VEESLHSDIRRAVVAILCWNLLGVVFAQEAPAARAENQQTFHASAYLQLRYTRADDTSPLYALRRFKVMLNGKLSENIEWYAQGFFEDGNETGVDGHPYLQEAWLRFSQWKDAAITVGQLKPPFGMERFTPDYELFTIDRSVVTDTLIPNGDMPGSFDRSRGFQVNGKPLRGRLSYSVGLLDGEGARQPFHGIGPLVATRIGYQPVERGHLKGRPLRLHIGGDFAFRRAQDLAFRGPWLSLPDFHGRDTRLGLEFSGDWGDASLRAEYIEAHFNFENTARPDFKADGFYAQAAKYLAPKWQIVAEFQGFNSHEPRLNPSGLRWTSVGVNYYIRANRLKLMADYIFKRERSYAAHDTLQVQFQYFFLK